MLPHSTSGDRLLSLFSTEPRNVIQPSKASGSAQNIEAIVLSSQSKDGAEQSEFKAAVTAYTKDAYFAKAKAGGSGRHNGVSADRLESQKEDIRYRDDPEYRKSRMDAAQAIQKKRDDFHDANGYHNKLTVQGYNGYAVTSTAKPSEASFPTRETAMSNMISGMRDIDHSVQRLNKMRDTAEKHPERLEGTSAYTKKLTHDLKGHVMDLSTHNAEFIRAFNVETPLTNGVDGLKGQGQITHNDYEIISSTYGHLGSMRGGELFVTREDGTEVRAQDYKVDRSKVESF